MDITAPDCVYSLRHVTLPPNVDAVRLAFSTCPDDEGFTRVIVFDIPESMREELVTLLTRQRRTTNGTLKT